MTIELGFEFTAMACPCALRLVGDSEAMLRSAAEAAIAEVRRIEATYSRYRSDSVVGRINAAAGSGLAVEVDDETAALLSFAARLYEDSSGRFDITSGVLRRAWDFRSGRVPTPAQIDALRPLVGWHQVHWDGRHLALPRSGMEIDLGGIGKEYAADRAAARLAEHGVAAGFVDLGGDMVILGPRGDGSAWRLAIQHPRQPEGLLAEVDLRGGALATSGDYARGFVVAGRRYSHLLDARTGWPVQRWQSVSVLAPTCTAAGALATVAMLLGDDALAFLRQQQQAFIAVRDDSACFAEGLQPCQVIGVFQ